MLNLKWKILEFSPSDHILAISDTDGRFQLYIEYEGEEQPNEVAEIGRAILATLNE